MDVPIPRKCGVLRFILLPGLAILATGISLWFEWLFSTGYGVVRARLYSPACKQVATFSLHIR